MTTVEAHHAAVGQDDDEETALQAKLSDWLSSRYRIASPDDSGPPEGEGDQDSAELEEKAFYAAVELQRSLFDAGLTGFSTRPDLGGHGVSREADRRLSRVLSNYRTPDLMPLAVGLSLVVPTLARYGTAEQQRAHIPTTLRADEVWCQLFSEPNFGSDLASLQTRAERDGEEWIVNGQKIWTSWARYSAFGILLARTDPEAPKHKGISMFLLDMASPGVEVRPLREMTGGWQFSEVFFTDVRVPATCLVGGLNEGWSVAMSTLTDERSEGALRSRKPQAARLIALAQQAGVAGRAPVRQRLADIWIRERILSVLAEIIMAGSAAPQSASKVSLVKVLSSELGQKIVELAVELEGPAALAWPSGSIPGRRAAFDLAHSRMGTIAGGTNQIQRNILAERVLGLPREPNRG